MTIVKTVTQIRCDGCQRAYIYPDGDIETFLVTHDWAVTGERHECPGCVRRAK